MRRASRGRKGDTPQEQRRWSAAVASLSTFPPTGLFTASAEAIAETMAKPEVSPGGLGAAIRMVTFFANRAGRNLPEERRMVLQEAKRLLRARKNGAPVLPSACRAPGHYQHVALGPVVVERHGRGWVMRRSGGEPPIPLGPDGWRYLQHL